MVILLVSIRGILISSLHDLSIIDYRCIDVRKAPSLYIIREDATIPSDDPDVMAGHPHSIEYFKPSVPYSPGVI